MRLYLPACYYWSVRKKTNRVSSVQLRRSVRALKLAARKQVAYRLIYGRTRNNINKRYIK